MQKLFFTLLCILLLSDVFSEPAENDSIIKPFFKNFNLSTVWFEYGYFIPIHEKKLQELPYGMNHYFYDTKGTTASGFFSLGLYYKETFGVELLYRQMDFNVDNGEYIRYLEMQHPGYYVPQTLSVYYYSLNKYEYRICYRKHFRRFTMEPKFQLGVNDYNSNGSSFTLKEKGSNQYIHYNISNENLNKNNFSYHFILNVSKQFNPFKNVFKIETALKLEYMMAPTEYEYSIEQSSYGKPSVFNQFTVKQLHPAIGIEACVYFYFKK